MPEWLVEFGDAPPRNFKKACTMVKRRKEEEIVGVLEFEGRTSEDPGVMKWLAEHKVQNRPKIRVSRGSTGVRVAFSKAADMALWRARVRAGARGSDRRIPEPYSNRRGYRH
jgi:hypothetical protein